MGLVLFCAGDIAVNKAKPMRLISKNGKTITSNIFIPPNEHSIRITGILNQS